MRTLDRYIGKTIIGAILTVLLVLVAIFSFFSFIDQLDDLGRGRYGLAAVIQYILLSMPRLTYELFPVSALIGTLIGLGTLVGNSEVAVMRNAGISIWRMVFAIMKAGALMMVLAVVFGEFLSPPSEQWARHARSVAITDQIALKTRNGFWARDGQSYINIRTVRPGDRVEDIFIYEFDENNRLKVSTHAQRAAYIDGQWMLEEIAQTVIKDGAVINRTISRAGWESLLRPDLINIVVIKPNNLASYDLVKYIRYLKTNGQQTKRYEQALWTKMIYPLTTGVMVLLAIPIVLGGSRAVPIGQRVVLGSLLGLGFRLLNQATANAGIAYDLNAPLSALFPTLITLVVAIHMMYRMTRLKQGYS